MRADNLSTNALPYQRWPFNSYGEYLDYQAARAKRTRRVTLSYANHRARLISLLQRYSPETRSVLAMGARHPAEIDDLSQAGFDAEGIDLIEDRNIRRCDMSDLDGSPEFRERRFDAFFFVHSLEHCWDFFGFQQRSLPHCRSIVAVVIPLRQGSEATAWDCVSYDFQDPDAERGAFERAFPDFELLHREFFERTLLFVMRRRAASEFGPQTSVGSSVQACESGRFWNVLVANHFPHSSVKRSELERLLSAQIENSFAVGWDAGQIRVLANFEFRHAGVCAEVVPLNDYCPRGSKMFAIVALLRGQTDADAVYWVHDLDCWQNHWFNAPLFSDVGICEYSRPIFNGGSVFWRPAAADIAQDVVQQLEANSAEREEPMLNRVLRDCRFRKRVTVLNPTYNVGCSGYRERWQRSEKPILASHFHPTNRLAWATHVLNRHKLPERSASERLEVLLRRWWPTCATEFHEQPPRLSKRARGREQNGVAK